MRLPFATAMALTAALMLSGCDTPEERAEEYYKRGVELVAEGEINGAVIEFRNALKENPKHKRARFDYASLLADQDNPREAIGHFLRLAEQDPANAAAHREVAQLAIGLQEYSLVDAHATQAYALDPEDLEIRALKATVDFRRGEAENALFLAKGVLEEDPGNVASHIVVIAERMAAEDSETALEMTDAALELAPESLDLHLARLAILEQMGDSEAAADHLKAMAERFPDNQDIRNALLQLHISQGDLAEAERILRAAAEETPRDPDGYLTVARFLLETDGPEAARGELVRLIETHSDPAPFQRSLAGLDFARGDRDAAIEGLREITEGQESTEDIRNMQTSLAQMLAQTGETDEARKLVAAILEGDDRNVDALKMRAREHIDADRTEQAIQDLRTALIEAPDDPEILTIMAMAHEREGAHDLVGERLALAVTAAKNRPAESLRYARFLMRDDRLGPAEDTLLDALRRAPENPQLLVALGQLHLQRRDWTRARQVAGTLRELGTQASEEAAAGLELASFEGEGRADDTIEMLQTLATDSQEGDLRARLGLVQAYVAENDIEAADAEVAEILAGDPASLAGRMMLAGLHTVKDETAEAEAIYRELAGERPELREPHQALIALLARDGREDEARAALDAGIEATDRDGNLIFTKAGLLVNDEDFDGAIALYQELYDQDTSNQVVANNLASLLSSHHDDDESLERAFAVARRLRGTEVPYFQDTYGWLLSRRGDYKQALVYLEPAAEALVADPLTHFHLGMTHVALEQFPEARAALVQAVEIAGSDSDLPQIAEAQAKIDEIDAMPATAPAE